MDQNQNSDVLDWQQGVENFSGDEEMYKGMLAKLEKLTLDEETKKMYEAFTTKNWAEVLANAHSLRGTGGQVIMRKPL